MKKLLTSLTILALISPITMANVNANEGIGEGSEPREAKTQASVEISGIQGDLRIDAKNKLEFEKIELKLGETSYSVDPKSELNFVNLIVEDTEFGVDLYTVKAKLIDEADNSFPEGTNLRLKVGEPELQTEAGGVKNEGLQAPDYSKNPISLLMGGEAQDVVWAVRSKEKPFHGAGKWMTKINAENININLTQDILKADTLQGTILWTIGRTSR